MTTDYLSEIADLTQKVEILEEDLRTRALEIENVGWQLLSGYPSDNDGLPLDSLKELSTSLREMASTNPWHKRGAQLRHSYVFGRGMAFQDLKPGTRAAIADPHNAETMFSVEAYEKNNLALFTDGNLIVLRNTKTNRFQTVPLREITGVVCHPDDDNVIWYVQRSWTSNKESRTEWYPVARHKNSVRTIPNQLTHNGVSVKVRQDVVAYIKRSNRQDGWTWGVPDSLAAKIFAVAYSGYLQDNTKLVHALSKFAWSITSGSKTGVDRAAAQVAAPGVGGTSVMGAGQDLTSVGVPSAQVNMNNGQPLIAAVAASFGVSVIALISSPGSTGGSYGAATTLDGPTLKGFEALQDSWKNFYEEILRDMGSRNATVQFPSLDSDPPYRQITGYAQLVELGILWPEEVRDAVLTLMDVPKLKDGLPPKPEVKQTVVSAQGQSGALGATSEPGGDTNHDNDEQ